MAERRRYSRGEWISAGVFTVVMLAAFAACSSNGSDGGSSDDSRPVRQAHGQGADSVGGGGLPVTASRFTEWPFTVTAGVLRCTAGSVTFEPAGGPEYAVNGTAQASGYPEIRPIWADDEELGYGLKIDISEVLNKGLTLC